MNENIWIIGICNSGADGVVISAVSVSTDEEIKEYLINLVEEDKSYDEAAFESDLSCETAEDIVAYSNDEYFAYATYCGYHIDYTAMRARTLLANSVNYGS